MARHRVLAMDYRSSYQLPAPPVLTTVTPAPPAPRSRNDTEQARSTFIGSSFIL
jgi:hypothetical protein